MTKILGLDYGKAKIGISFADGPLASPIEVIHYTNLDFAIEKIRLLTQEFGVEKIIVGVSEGKMGEESKKFSLDLEEKLKISTETFDETLSSLDARFLSRQAGIKQKKRKEMEDAYAATVMLQNYLDIS